VGAIASDREQAFGHAAVIEMRIAHPDVESMLIFGYRA
jgi:hypothetical protein